MLMTSKETLKSEAKFRGYHPEILEKVYRLLDLLENFMAVPYLKERMALKGGTAINLFCTNMLPRLSVDLDFNYIGSVERDVMKQERQQLESILLDICDRQRYSLHRNPRAHAGGKIVLVYNSILGNKGRLEIDLNYMFRVPLWTPVSKGSPDWLKPTKTSVLDIHELAAGKLHALLSRHASRDLFDSHQLLTSWNLDSDKLKLAFTVYAAMESVDWKKISTDNINYTIKDIRDKLVPVLKRNKIPSMKRHDIESWANQLKNETCYAMSKLLPFNKDEQEFLSCLQERGEIKPDIICNDKEFCQRISTHPLLTWRAQQSLK